jgi:predicted nucleic acid-binding protein
LKGWLLDTNIIASLTSPSGAPAVRTWVAAQNEQTLYLSVITLGEYDKGIHQLPEEHSQKARYIANRDAIEARFGARILPVSNQVIRRWGAITGRVKRETGHAPPVMDTLLAATAIVFNPWEDDQSLFPIGT